MIVPDKHLKVLRCTGCHSKLDIQKVYGSDSGPFYQLLCLECGNEYPIRLGYPYFLDGMMLQHPGRWIKFVRSVYSRVYTPATNLMFVFCGGASDARYEVLEQLDIRPGHSVLETGIGAGDNLPFIYEMYEPGEYFGMDIQQQMLNLCKKNLFKWKMEAHLCHANAEHLPYADESFDSVFHLGAINLFTDKKRAIDEMIRVARPGTKIVIADESEKANRLLTLVMGKQPKVVPPVDLVPSEMEDIHLKDIWKGYGYLIAFRKPGREAVESR